MYPFDTIKTHLQVNQSSMTKVTEKMVELYRVEGLLRFWRGLPAVLCGVIPAHAFYFSVYQIIRNYINVNQSSESYNILAVLAGSGATMFHDLINTPFDVVKQRMQINNCYTMRQCFQNTIKKQGFIALFRSLPITMLMNIPQHGITVGINQNLKIKFKPNHKRIKYLWYFLCAGVAGAIAAMLTNPLDVIKTRLQTQFHSNQSCIPCMSDKKAQKFSAFQSNQPKSEVETDQEFQKRQLSRLAQQKIHSRYEQKYRHHNQNRKMKAGYLNYMNIPSTFCSFNNSSHSKKLFFSKADKNLQSSTRFYNPLKSNEQAVYYRSVSKIIRQIYYKEGMTAFMKGVVPRMITIFPSMGISWCTYEFLKNKLSQHQQNIKKYAI